MNHGSLFSGIGGFDVAAEWMGWNNVFHCEIAEFPRKVLKHYWPGAISYHDITKTDFTIHRGKIDILTGGFPCQPYSVAGKRKGKEDERHLWPEMLRAVREIRPRWIIGENVYGLVNWSGGLVFDEVQSDLEAEGYEVFPYVLPACAVNAPHRRDRIWFVAKNTNQDGWQCNVRERTTGERRQWNTSTGDNERLQTYNEKAIPYASGFRRIQAKGRERSQLHREYAQGEWDSWARFPTQSPVLGGDDGIPFNLDGITFPKWRSESIQAYGNAVVPQVVYQLFKTIEAYESQENRRKPNKLS